MRSLQRTMDLEIPGMWILDRAPVCPTADQFRTSPRAKKVTCPNATTYKAGLDQHCKNLFDPDGSAASAEIVTKHGPFSPILSR